ncbi:hypothetical protein QTG54_008807 [Skeletonema marinoi]|uniref:Uncharacterized protein n=1 Tax=Skeletonema marinoi TaxID=267567 RepID=A0AAD9DAZ2_9STRA|nr:hypothetical protein QTG54_008807 [Skeletonema marinoi]
MDRLFIPHCGYSYAEHAPGVDETKNVITDVSNPTQLFSFLQQRDWEEALTCLRRSPHQARTWVRHQSTSRVNNWSMLPLHAAVAYGAPLHLLKELVTINPNALRKQDHEGKLPLHYAAIFSSTDQQDVMSHMLKCYPETMWIKASCGRTAIEYSRNDELQTMERIRMRKKLSGNIADDEDHENTLNALDTLDTLADIVVHEKENERKVMKAVSGQKRHRDPTDAQGEISAGSNVSSQESETYTKQIQKTTMSNIRDIQQKLSKKKMQFPIQTKRSRESEAVDDKSNGDESESIKTEQDEGSSCLLDCSAEVEEVDQSGRRTVYLNFAMGNEDTDDDDDDDALPEPRDTSEKEDASKSYDIAYHHNSKNRIMSVLQTASSMKSFKRQKVSGV